MTSSLGLRAVAEVVETQAAAQALVQMGCSYGQGYFFSEPVEAESALEQLRSHVYPTSVVPTISTTGLEHDAADTMIEAPTPAESAAVPLADTQTHGYRNCPPRGRPTPLP